MGHVPAWLYDLIEVWVPIFIREFWAERGHDDNCLAWSWTLSQKKKKNPSTPCLPAPRKEEWPLSSFLHRMVNTTVSTVWVWIQDSLFVLINFQEKESWFVGLLQGLSTVHLEYLVLGTIYAVFKFLFCWSVVDSQCCVNFCCSAQWFSYTYTYILLHILFRYSLS